jgi:hypothetical protein
LPSNTKYEGTKLPTNVISYDISDDKSISENVEIYKEKLKEIDPELGPLLADFLPSLMKEPNGDKSAMLATLRAALDIDVESSSEQTEEPTL